MTSDMNLKINYLQTEVNFSSLQGTSNTMLSLDHNNSFILCKGSEKT